MRLEALSVTMFVAVVGRVGNGCSVRGTASLGRAADADPADGSGKAYGSILYHMVDIIAMSLHDYVADLASGKTSLRLIKTLLNYRGKVFTIRGLARTAGVSHPEASKILKKYEKRAAVRLQPIGRAQQVSLNEGSYVLRSVLEPLFKAEKETMSAIVSTIARFFDHERIISVVIFGSVARGTGGRSSDIDLLVVTSDRDLAVECASKASAAVVSEFGAALSPLIIDEGRFARQQGDLERSILDSYIPVAGRDLKEVAASGKTDG